MLFSRMITDCNGFCLFDPVVLERALGRAPEPEENLLRLFRTGAQGDEVLRMGAVVPIYPITDGVYDLQLRFRTMPPPVLSPSAVLHARTGVYPLHVLSRLVFADLAVLQEWAPEEAWREVECGAGFYAVVISAYVTKAPALPVFDIELSAMPTLPQLTADLGLNLDVLQAAAPERAS